MFNQLEVQFDHCGQLYQISLSLNAEWGFYGKEEAKDWWTSFFKNFFTEHSTLSPKDLKEADEKGVRLLDGRRVTHPSLRGLGASAKKTQGIWDSLPVLPSSYQKAMSNHHEEERLLVHGISETRFETTHASHPTDRIPLLKREREYSSQEAMVLDFGKNIASRQGKVEMVHEPSLMAAFLSSIPRKNSRMKMILEGALKEFFGKTILSSEILLKKNSVLNGSRVGNVVIQDALTPSLDRNAENIALLRKEQAEDGTSDCYAGRVDSLVKAKEMAEYIFLGEIDLFEEKSSAKGIVKREDGAYELSFAVQSLLNMNGSEAKLLSQEIDAYEEVAKKPLSIQHPVSKKRYTVYVRPIPIAANQFNATNYLEELLPASISGSARAKKLSLKADAQLRVIAERKIRQERNFNKREMIRDSLYLLEHDVLKKPWEQMITRAFLVYLLDLPLVVHCKSCVDRTGGVVIPMIFAMKEWVRASKPIPMKQGRYAISEIVRQNVAGIHPFQELFLSKMLHELQMSEYARGKKGYKLFENRILHPALRDLLPERMVKTSFIPLFDRLQNLPDGRSFLP